MGEVAVSMSYCNRTSARVVAMATRSRQRMGRQGEVGEAAPVEAPDAGQ